MTLQTDIEARSSMTCVCGNAKELNCVCCWDCFKRGPLPFKYFDGTFEQWQTERRHSIAV